MGIAAPSVDAVARAMVARVPLYRWRSPVYQAEMLAGLARAWDEVPRTILDIGGGTGLIAQIVQELFPPAEVTVIDVHDRFLPGLSVRTQVYDGETIPFESGSFECAILLNVLHHVPAAMRPRLVSECLRATGGGPVHIKDHLSGGVLDNRRLWALDLLGNAPFKGMVEAEYLRAQDWHRLAEQTGCIVQHHPLGPVRSGPLAALFPNRLEVLMTWRQAPRH
jgi:SAM-dependent methyltransferase